MTEEHDSERRGPFVAAPATARRLLAVVRATDLGFLAASVAYYAFVSILPSLLLLFLAVSAVSGEELARAVVRQATLLTPTGQELIREALVGSTARLEVSILSVLVLLWGTARLFRSLTHAFSRIHGTKADRSPLETVRNAAVVLGAVTVSFVLQTAVSLPEAVFVARLPLLGRFDQLELFVGLCLTLFPLYYLLPPVPLTARQALPGTVVAAGGWLVLEFGFVLYTRFVAGASVYGVFGTFILFVVWLYFTGLLLLLGASLNAVLAGGGAPAGASE